MEILTFTLKQHTPMLHFQASQQGATLRATDVKPRFDRWLIEKVWKNDFDKCCPFLVGYSEKFSEDFRQKFNAGYRALNYKMSIVVEAGYENNTPQSTHKTNNNGKKVSSYPMYFGNEVYTVCRPCLVKFVVLESVKGLSEYINENFAEFINSHNFGTRSSKGYGSFTVKGYEMPPYVYVSLKAKNWNDVLKQVDLFYKTIRSGINFTRRMFDKNKNPLKDADGNDKKEGYYFKSMLHAYFEKKFPKKYWDKKVIKTRFLKGNPAPVSNDMKVDVRDFLGLSSSEMWGWYNMKISKSVDGIKRFPSPVVFKPIKYGNIWRVYLIVSEIPEKFKGCEVVVKAEKANPDKAARKLIPDFQDIILRGMRTAQDFSIEDYFKYLFIECPNGMSETDWLDAKDIQMRFVKYENPNEHQIGQIVGFYRSLRKAYRNRQGV